MSAHELKLIPQPIADGWQAKCTCGWKSFSYFQDFDATDHFGTRDEVLAELQKQFNLHIETGV